MKPEEFKTWQSRWKRYAAFQKKEKAQSLQRLTPEQGIKMFFELHAFAEQFIPRIVHQPPEWHTVKMQNLLRMRNLFMDASRDPF